MMGNRFVSWGLVFVLLSVCIYFVNANTEGHTKVSKILHKTQIDKDVKDSVIHSLESEKKRDQIRNNLKEHSKKRDPSPSSTTYPKQVLAIPEIYASRIMLEDENSITLNLGSWIGFYRTYSPREEGKFAFNAQFGLRQIAMNLSLTAAQVKSTNTVPFLPLFNNFIVCQLNLIAQPFGQVYPEGVDFKAAPGAQLEFEVPVFCISSFEIISIQGVNADDIQNKLYKQYSSSLLNTDQKDITVQCAHDPSTPVLVTQNNIQPSYYCTFIFLGIVGTDLAATNCLCVNRAYRCCSDAILETVGIPYPSAYPTPSLTPSESITPSITVSSSLTSTLTPSRSPAPVNPGL